MSRPVAPFDPDRYPGPRPDGPSLVHAGQVHALDLAADSPSEALAVPAAPVVADASDAPQVVDLDQVRWVVAYGSNASPGRLVAKGLDRRGAWLLPAVLEGWVPAFEQRRTGYGSVPLTLVPEPGVRIATWVLGVHVDDLPALDRSEGRLPAVGAGIAPAAGAGIAPAVGAGIAPDDERTAPPGAYQLGRVGEVQVAQRWRLPAALAYLPGPNTRLQVTGAGGWRTWPRWGQRAAAAHVDARGPSRPAPTPGDPVAPLDAWPVTPLLPVG